MSQITSWKGVPEEPYTSEATVDVKEKTETKPDENAEPGSNNHDTTDELQQTRIPGPEEGNVVEVEFQVDKKGLVEDEKFQVSEVRNSGNSGINHNYLRSYVSYTASGTISPCLRAKSRRRLRPSNLK